MTAAPLAPIEPLPEHLSARGGSVDLIRAELLAVIKNAIVNHPRSQQKAIGPSEVPHPCARRIGYKLGGAPEINHQPDDTPWLPTIGTAVHAWLEEQFIAANAGGDSTRWLAELRVAVGAILGAEITGSMDLYDRATATIVDWKIIGPTTLKKYKAKGPGQQYRGQIHLYGRGATRRNLPVDNVMIAFLPRNGELRDAYLWSEPYDEQVALDALQRAEGIALSIGTLGPAAYPLLPTADAFCTRCPYYRRGSTDPVAGCPGDENAPIPHGSAPALTLI